VRFHHGVIAVRDLARSIGAFHDALGLNARAGGRHGGRGTENAVIAFEDGSYIELLSVFDPEKEIAVSGERGRVLADFIRAHEGGLVGYCLDTTEVFEQARRLRGEGVEVPEPLLVSRTTPSGDALKWHVLLPGGVNWRRRWPFLIQPDAANVDENAGASDRVHPLGVTGVCGAAVAVEDIERGKSLYAAFGLKLSGEDRVPGLGAQRARFVQEGCAIDLLAPLGPGAVRTELDAAGEGLFQLTLRVKDLDASKAWLAKSGVALAAAPGYPGCCLVPPERAVWARLVLAP
jgi:catechol 2,3-dioxygenase-like lactoylglutathione lyase family enzyme